VPWIPDSGTFAFSGFELGRADAQASPREIQRRRALGEVQ
jgi:hypothetical protein